MVDSVESRMKHGLANPEIFIFSFSPSRKILGLYLENAVIASLQIPSSSPFISNVIQHYIISVSYSVVTKLQHSKLMKCRLVQ